MKTRLLIFIILAFSNLCVNAQTITGYVFDAKDGEPLIGAAVYCGKKGAVADMDGKFELDVSPGEMLNVSYVGFKKVTVKASDNMQIAMGKGKYKQIKQSKYRAALKKAQTSSTASSNINDNNNSISSTPVSKSTSVSNSTLSASKTNYFYVEAMSAGVTVKIASEGKAPNITLLYSSDGYTWNNYIVNTTITLTNVGNKLYFKAGSSGNVQLSSKYTDCNHFVFSGLVKVGGDITTLLSAGGNVTDLSVYKKNVLSVLFRDCKTLIDASALLLPSTTLVNDCYFRMFWNCTSLTTAPQLPAMNLAEYCYYEMFWNCSSLTAAPQLPATKLAKWCYLNMFRECTKLTAAPALPATTLVNSCYAGMFLDCTSLTHAPKLPATTLAESCYNRMFQGCTNLRTAPVLPAMNLARSCYGGMFWSCKNLTSAPELPATTLAEWCYNHMFSNCSSLTTAPKLPATTMKDHCYAWMFWDCRSLTSAPELPALTLAPDCYNMMFAGCSSLTTAPSLPATTLAENCYKDMFQNCNIQNVASNSSSTKVSSQGASAQIQNAWLEHNCIINGKKSMKIHCDFNVQGMMGKQGFMGIWIKEMPQGSWHSVNSEYVSSDGIGYFRWNFTPGYDNAEYSDAWLGPSIEQLNFTPGVTKNYVATVYIFDEKSNILAQSQPLSFNGTGPTPAPQTSKAQPRSNYKSTYIPVQVSSYNTRNSSNSNVRKSSTTSASTHQTQSSYNSSSNQKTSTSNQRSTTRKSSSSGVSEKEPEKCSKCNGSGKVNCRHCKGSGRVTCPACKGGGYNKVAKQKCITCNSKGTIKCSFCYGEGTERCINCNGKGKK